MEITVKSVGCFFAENVGIAIFKLHTSTCTHTAVHVSLGTSSLAVAVRRHIGLPPSILHSWQQQALSFSACSPSCTVASIPTGTGTAQIGKTASNRLQPQVLMSPAKRHHKQSQVIFIPPSCIAVSHRVCNLCAHFTDTGKPLLWSYQAWSVCDTLLHHQHSSLWECDLDWHRADIVFADA